MFLMYRVELKPLSGASNPVFNLFVPNVPCGVETVLYLVKAYTCAHMFLMYRVELKLLGIDAGVCVIKCS